MFCPHCGKTILEQSKFCKHCGRIVASSESHSESRPYNKLAIWALLTSLFIPVVPFILGIISVRVISKSKERGIIFASIAMLINFFQSLFIVGQISLYLFYS